jgi:acetyl CoA:N6-hydroxylysine acetyl transferase
MKHMLFKEPHHFFFSNPVDGAFLNVRPLLPSDLTLIHGWVNQPYALRFWNMQGSLEDLTKEYQKQKEDNISSNFLVCYNTQPIALFEVYQVSSTELAFTYESATGDFGIHLLMAPHSELLPMKKDIKKISEKTLLTILDMLFSYHSVQRVVAEPDSKNVYACRLAENAGLHFFSEIQLTEKKANLYMITKEQHLQQVCGK